jgi:hypothetical protein
LTGGGAGEVQPAHRVGGAGASAQAQTLRVQDTEENQEKGRLSQVLLCYGGCGSSTRYRREPRKRKTFSGIIFLLRIWF